MESWRPRTPQTSSSDEDQVRSDDHNSGAATVKRSYECTFCKRGFTNAQALGGHMNIHRKDRVKPMQHISGTSSLNANHYSNEDQYISMSTSHHHHQYSSVPLSSQGVSGYYPVFDQMNYQRYFQPTGSNPRIPYGYDLDDSSVGLSSHSLGMNQELWGTNLSLQLEDDEFRRGVWSNDEVDLELRLGHG
ncbi:unnamed protein product [Malus baccata var. baccata]